MPQTTVQQRALRPPRTTPSPSLRFGEAKAPISANPFVWVLNGIKSLYERFSRTKVGQWFNRMLGKINQFLKAKPKASPKPAAPAPSPAPVSTPAQTQTQTQTDPAPASEPQAEPPTEPVAETPPEAKAKAAFVPYSERPLEALQEKLTKLQRLCNQFPQEPGKLEKTLEKILKQVEANLAELRTQLENDLRQDASASEASSDKLRQQLRIVEAEIKVRKQNRQDLPILRDILQRQMLALQEFIQLRQEP